MAGRAEREGARRERAHRLLAGGDARGIALTWRALLIAAGSDVNAKDGIEDSPYLLAGASGHVEICA